MTIEIEEIIKIVIGLIVLTAIAFGIFMFKDRIMEFFKGLSVETPSAILALIK